MSKLFRIVNNADEVNVVVAEDADEARSLYTDWHHGVETQWNVIDNVKEVSLEEYRKEAVNTIITEMFDENDYPEIFNKKEESMKKQTMTNQQIVTKFGELLNKFWDDNGPKNYKEAGIAQLMDSQGAEYIATHVWCLEDGAIIEDHGRGPHYIPAKRTWPGNLDYSEFHHSVGGEGGTCEMMEPGIYWVTLHGYPSGFMYVDEAEQLSFPNVYASIKAAKLGLAEYVKHNL